MEKPRFFMVFLPFSIPPHLQSRALHLLSHVGAQTRGAHAPLEAPSLRQVAPAQRGQLGAQREELITCGGRRRWDGWDGLVGFVGVGGMDWVKVEEINYS